MFPSVTFPCHRYHFDSGLEPGSYPDKTGVTAIAIGDCPTVGHSCCGFFGDFSGWLETLGPCFSYHIGSGAG